MEVSGLTDAAGHIALPVSGLIDGEILLTVTGRNLYPVLEKRERGGCIRVD